MSLRLRVALALGALAAAATLVVGVAGYRSASDRLMVEVDRSLSETVRLVPVDRRGQVVSLPPRGPLSVYEVQVLAPDGTVQLTSFPAEVDPGDAARTVSGRSGAVVVETIELDGIAYRVRTVGFATGGVQVARSLEEIDRVLDALRGRTVVVILLVTLVAAGSGWIIAGRVTASLRRLTRAADTVASTGRLDVEVPVRGDDEVGRLGAAFTSMLDALARSRAEQRRLVEDAGHELRTPLTSVRTDVDVLHRYPDLPAAQRAEIVEDLRRETDELIGLVDEIVTVASGVAPDEPFEDVVLADLVGEVADRFERRTGRAVRVHADRAVVRAQPTAIQRAVSNLVDNARKFDTSESPIEVTVRAGTVEVADRGPGIPADEHARVFERFHRAVHARTAPGSGLGLAIVADIVRRHGGERWVRDREGGGAVVGFGLRVPGELLPPPPLSPDSQPVAGLPSPAERTLVVDRPTGPTRREEHT